MQKCSCGRPLYETGNNKNFRRYISIIEDNNVSDIVNRLRKYEVLTQPTSGRTAPDKDLLSREALRDAGLLVSKLAGWAIDHQAGLAISGASEDAFIQPDDCSGSEYIDIRAKVCDHGHEVIGAAYCCGYGEHSECYPRAPALDRRVLCAVLTVLADRLGSVAYSAMNALHALDFGEVQPILRPVKSRRNGNSYSLDIARLYAISHVEHLRSLGMKKNAAVTRVAEAYGATVDAVLAWEKRLPSTLGEIFVRHTLKHAKANITLDDYADKQTLSTGSSGMWFTEKSLAGDARKYKDLLRSLESDS
ncbi:MAG: hypothetical protein H7840_15425 [Alphaproteobacteria bacterium]